MSLILAGSISLDSTFKQDEFKNAATAQNTKLLNRLHLDYIV